MAAKLTLFTLAATAAALPSSKRADTANSSYLYFPLDFFYGVDSRFTTNLTLGTAPDSKPIKTVVDTGSASFWTWAPSAVVHWGSQYLGVEGPCNITVPTRYDPSASSTAVLTNHTNGYSYAGNAKVVSGARYANDTLTSSVVADTTIPNVQFAIEDKGVIRQLSGAVCATDIPYDQGILGLAPRINNSNLAAGPLFRDELYAAGELQSQTLFMWMDAAPETLGSTLTGGLLFDAIDESKYTGDLVKVSARNQPDFSVGPYVAAPNVTLGGAVDVVTSTTVQCLVDSGAHGDTLPFAYDSPELPVFLNASGLVDYHGILAYNGTCESIPQDLKITYSFAGVDAGESVDIAIPLRNFARGTNYAGTEGLCVLNLEYGASCLLGATFLTSAAMVLDDANGGSVAFAQGGVSVAGSGVDAASVKTIGRGQTWDSV